MQHRLSSNMHNVVGQILEIAVKCVYLGHTPLFCDVPKIWALISNWGEHEQALNLW